MLTAIIAMSSQFGSPKMFDMGDTLKEKLPTLPPVPKGCKRYWVTVSGITAKHHDGCENGKYFDALTYERAEGKYTKWLQSNHNIKMTT